MTSVLLCCAGPTDALRADCAAMGLEVLGACAPAQLLAESARLAPDVLVCDEPDPARELLPVLAALASHAPRPVLLFSRDAEVQTLEQALRCGVQAYVVNGYAAARLRPLVQLARSRFALEREQRAALADLNERFEERKLVDRAKGILMRARRIGEDEAFGLLRAAAMQEQRRIGQLARRVIDAERDAEAVNDAGRLRMLSQRLVSQVALQCAQVDTALATARRQAAEREVGQHLSRLTQTLSRPTFGDLLDPLAAAWQALQELLPAAPQAATLAAVDAAAERMLVAAEALTTALEAASPLATLAVVNRAGRQRMLCQRLAKQALIATLGAGDQAQAAAAASVQTIEAFEQALGRLAEAPLSSAAIRADLAQATLEWRSLLAGMRDAASERGRQQIALASEALLALFERLTEHYSQAVRQLFDNA
jgi:AmiR/NasT family two-component response regulator